MQGLASSASARLSLAPPRSPPSRALCLAQRGWSLEGSTVTFAKMEAEEPTSQKLPSSQLIQETLSYAKELERIV